MIIKEISYYKNFKCLEGSCPHTCCHGWIIPISEDEFERFMQEKGLLKLRLVLAMFFRNGTGFNTGCRTCTFHTKLGLCELQLIKGHDFLPSACREFPRFYRNYGPFEERYLDLSCIKAVQMFFDNMDDLRLVEYEGEKGSDICTTNDDHGFLNALMAKRDEMLGLLKGCDDADRLDRVLAAIADHAKKAQDAFVLGDTGYLDREKTEVLPLDEKCPRIFPAASGILMEILDTGLYSSRLRMTNPALYMLFSLPLKEYRHLMASQKVWDNQWKEFVKRHPRVVKICSAYYSYYLMQYYFAAYEDYSFLRHVMMGIIHTNMVFLLMCLHEKYAGDLLDDHAMTIIACYNRRAYFNDNVKDEMYDVFMRHFQNNRP